MSFQQYPQKFGIPSGDTAARPASAVEGDTYYNGELGLLEIYSDGQWIPCSAPAGIPTVVGTDVGTGRAYTSGAIAYTFTAGTNGGTPYGYTGSATSGATAYTTGAVTSSTVTLSVGVPGTYSVSGTAYNGFGVSPASIASNVTVTTVPEAPTIGSATISGSTSDVTISWTLNNNGGKNLSAITITPFLNGTTAQTSQTAATTSSTSHVFTGLTQGSSYTFKVKTTNANGTSIDSTATTSVTVPTLITVDALVIAGGGGGGYLTGGGGGAGGVYALASNTLGTGTGFTCSVGAGGAAASGVGSKGTSGTNSQFASLTPASVGGGGGGSNSNPVGADGGSGGGAGGTGDSTDHAGGSPTTGQGYAGGRHSSSSPSYGSGGGGGAGGAGANGTSTAGGAAGAGVNTYTNATWLADAVSASSNAIGVSGYFAGGGGGGRYDSGTGGAGGSGGGGTGGGTSGGSNGGTNTGGGGGGGGSPSHILNGGAGGSGIIIIRYSSSNTCTIGSGLSGNTYTSGSFKYTTLLSGTGTVTFS